MSLIPYHPREGREVVLRHHNAIVVRDTSSQRLEIRGLNTLTAECPTCHQPLRTSSPERPFDASVHNETYVDPDYFRMLRAGHDDVDVQDGPPASPVRGYVEPSPPHHVAPEQRVDNAAEFVSSTPAIQGESRIRKEFFSPRYFRTFFVEEGELGRGGKGVVLLVRHEIDGCHLGNFACKRVPVGDNHIWLEKVLVEVELLAKLSHPNLVSYRHVWLEDYQFNRFGPPVATAFILQQYCNKGDLLRYVLGSTRKEATKEELKAKIRRRSRSSSDEPRDLHPGQRHLEFPEIYSLFRDITSGLAYLHAANYIHRDLKPSNCLLHSEGNNLTCLISDFGEVQPENVVRNSTGTTGTISYCAPEVLKKDATGRYGNFSTKSDVFSLGMILYFLCFGHLPYQSANLVHEELEDIDLLRAEISDWKGFEEERRERPDLPSKLYTLLKRMLALNPTERPSAREVLSAMKSESGLDGLTRGSRSTSPSGFGGRIQSLDSPIPPGTPIPDPSKRARVESVANGDLSSLTGQETSPQPSVQNTLQKIPHTGSTARHRAPTMALSRSHDGFSRSSSDLSPPSPGTTRPHLSPTTTPPLLMPPPTTFLGGVQHRAIVFRYWGGRYAHTYRETISFFLRLLLFLAKMTTLARPCWPYNVDFRVGIPLVVIAAMDLGLPINANERRLSGNNGSRGPETAMPTHWQWDWRFSSVLVLFHLLSLWVATRYGTLCAVSPKDWVDW